MTEKLIREALDELYPTVEQMKRRYAKAAKKKRVLKKWTNRFGNSYDMGKPYWWRFND